MTQFSRILCVIDPTQDSQPALQRATWLAKISGASIDLLICYYNEYLSGERFFDSRSLKKSREETLRLQERNLKTLAKPLVESGLDVRTTVVWDHPLYEGIARQSIALKSDVVFKDTHDHSALSQALLTNTDWSLIRTCPVPLWLVSPQDVIENPSIIAAIDPFNEHDKPAALDDQILNIGNDIATDVGGDLHVFHSVDPRLAISASMAGANIPVSPTLVEIERDMTEFHAKRLKEIAKRHDIPDDRTHLAVGPTHKELPEFAMSLNSSLVIMGAVSRNRLKRLFIGATAERTLGLLPSDLLIIKPNPFVTPIEMDVE
jgi:universal stress protein E